MTVLAHTVLCAVLFWSAWCRLVKADSRTREPVRLAFWLCAAAALVTGIAPWGAALWAWFPKYEPSLVTVFLLLSFAAVQLHRPLLACRTATRLSTHGRLSPEGASMKVSEFWRDTARPWLGRVWTEFRAWPRAAQWTVAGLVLAAGVFLWL